MQVSEVREVLNAQGIAAPELVFLRPDEATYTALLLQPSGPVYADADRIGGLHPELNGQKAFAFAHLATERNAHLAVAPEYFTPWTAIASLLHQGLTPPPGALWALGCESITAEELTRFKADVADVCDVIFEPLEDLAAGRKHLDPVILMFASKRSTGEDCLVALVQFKTAPSRDPVFLEESVLQRGTAVYRFKSPCDTLKAVTLICSDVFELTDDQVADLVDRSTVIHIQLNPAPRNEAYREYRTTAFRLDPRISNSHIVCLNWARAVVEHDSAGNSKNWPAVGCSTWYCSKDSCSSADAIVLPNHEQGLYYTYMEEHRHALVFDYDEAVFECRVPKVVTRRLAILANRNGPSCNARYVWDSQVQSWVRQTSAPRTGFAEALAADTDASAALQLAPDANPLNVERLLALSSGAISSGDGWRDISNIDSFRIGRDEVVNRITVAQEISPSAASFRHARFQTVANIRHELNTRGGWPPQVGGLDPRAQIQWAPPFNVVCAEDEPALVCYLGEAPEPRVLENVASGLTDLLRHAGGDNQYRLCVAYRRFGQLQFANLPFTRFDDATHDQRDIFQADTSETTEQQ